MNRDPLNFLREEWRAIVSFFVVVLIALLLASLNSGCSTSKHKPAPSKTDATGTIEEGQKKDEDIATEAKGIVANPTDSAFVTASASRIMDVLRLSPWSRTEATIRALIAERDSALATAKSQAETDAKTIAKLTRERDEARSMVDRVIRIGGYAFAGILAAAAAASLFLAAQVPWLGPRISAALGAASVSIFALVWAYEFTKQHPWVTAISGACILVALVLAWANHTHEKSHRK